MTELRLEGVTAGYGDTVVLEDITIVVPENRGLAILGRNGVGKTTLLSTIMGLTNIRSGSINFSGTDLLSLSIEERASAGLGFVPQEREIFQSLSVQENLVVAQRNGRWSIERAYDLFPRLAERRRNYGNQLSGGEQQMLAIARALVINPRLLLLDEPFEGLAPILIDALLLALKRIRDEDQMGMLLVEQHAQLALELTQDAIVLDRGQVRWQGESRNLLSDTELLTSMIGL